MSPLRGWINNLRNDLTVEQLELFANLADADLPLDAYMYAVGKAVGKKESVLTVLRTRFHWVPEDIEKAVLAMSDPIALESLLAQAIQCETLDEFAEVLR